MYTPGLGNIMMLPNTGGNELLIIVSVLSVFIGSIIVLSTIARSIIKKIYKA